MKPSQMTDEVLLRETRCLVQKERETLSEILRHLHEIQRRRLFATLKCASLFEYATRELGYSEDQAYRRIQAMRLTQELPELEGRLNAGVLSLTHLGMAQSLFKKEEKVAERKFTRAEKLQVLDRLENTTKREAEKVLLTVSSTSEFVMPTEKVRAVSADQVEVRFTAESELLEKFEKLKGLLAHKNPHLKLADLIDQLCDLGLQTWDRATAPARNLLKVSSEVKPTSLASIRRGAWREARGRCANCASHFALEIDHRVPKVFGGTNSRENLRLLCRSCNQRAAIERLGMQHMEIYLNG